jgi:sugar (glycoside-pentoside-hexuronide) transporter
MTESDNPKTKQIPFSFLFFYSLPMVGGGMMNMLIGNYLMKYSTDVLLIAPGMMGLIFFISRIWDAVNDPICGYLSDHSRPRMGRRKSWIFFSMVPTSLSFYMLWNPPQNLDSATLPIWLGLNILIFFTSITALYVPHYSLGAELSGEYFQRNRIYGFRALAENIGNFMGIGAMTLITLTVHIRHDIPRYVLAISLLSALLTILMIWKTREPEAEKFHAKGRILPSFINVIQNPNARIILAVGFLSQMGAAVIMGMALYFAEYILLRPQKGPIFIGVFMIAATLSIPLWIKISKKFEKKNLWLGAKLFLGTGFGLTFFLGPGDDIPMIIICLILGIAAGSVLILNPSMLADTIDFDEFMSGERKEGVYFSVFTFMNKSAMGLSAVVIGFILQLSGFKPNQDQVESAQTAIRFLNAIIPLLCFLGGAFILSFYKFNRKEHALIQDQIRKGL